MKTLYLAHPFDDRFLVREWELDFETRTGIQLVNPFYDITRKDVDPIDCGRAQRYELLNPDELVERDVNTIVKQDGLVAIISGALSYGTIQEMVYGKLYHKPVYSIITNGHHQHPWLQYHSTKIFLNREEFEKFVTDKLVEK